MSCNAAAVDATLAPAPAVTAAPSRAPRMELVVDNKKSTGKARRASFDAWAWRPRVSAPYIDRVVLLNSVFAQKALRSLFPRLQLAAYGMSVTIPILERDKGQTVEVLEQAFDDALSEILRLQKAAVQRYEALLSENAVRRSVRYSPKEEQFSVFSPNANKAVTMFEGLDHVCALVDELWYAGIFSSMQMKRAINEIRSQVRNFVNRMDGLWKRAKSATLRAAEPGELESIRDAMGPVFDANLAVADGAEHEELQVHEESAPTSVDRRKTRKAAASAEAVAETNAE